VDEHTEECAELYAAWRRYHGVAEDASGVFTTDDRLAAAHHRDMFARQLTTLGCDPFALLAIEEAEALDEGDEE
jgi:hypothetical protein